MADFDTRTIRDTSLADARDAGLRKYMQNIYNYMFLGLAMTGITAYGTYLASVTTDHALAAGTLPNGVMLTQIGVTLFGSALRWVVIFSPLALVFLLQARLNSISAGAARIGFFAYAALLGVSLATIFMVYTMTSIGMVFFITAATFAGMSLYGYTTKADLSGWGSFLIMGVWGVVIASVVNVFLHSPMLLFVFSVVGVIVFTGITAFYTQRIKDMYSVHDDGSVAERKAIVGALALYITFINLFLSLLNLFGGSRR
ncbi:MAG TPA: Bax inhibitor-1/YccA family protein [Rhizomicrobium sp.]|jgi:hypothetical protein